MSKHVGHAHQNTIDEIFSKPTSGNVRWHKVLTLMEALGTVEQQHNSHVRVTIGPETETLHVPKGKDIELELLLDIRRMLTNAGYAPGGEPPVPDELDRNHGDNRWGDPRND